ncbi:hypothetical protein [Maribacter sp. R77961]|uniref:hypothetical protein n=1 Tax=Maribacter sp. R77961 TaxID=3093871 RepID=UPI0037CA16B0
MNKDIQDIFSRNEVIDKIAFLNWRMESGDIVNLFNLGDGYFDSAIILCDRCLSKNKGKIADILIFPIFMNFNHGIELYLKGLTLTLNELLKIDIKIDGTHNLNQLFSVLKARIKDLDGQKKANEIVKDNFNLREYLNELTTTLNPNQKNDKMDFSRYPFTKKEGNHFYVDTWNNIEVDLENLKNRITIIYQKLEQYADYFYYERLQENN